MKQFLVLLLVAAAAAGGWLTRGLLSAHQSGDPEVTSEAGSEAPGIEVNNGAVKLDEETAGRLGIAATPLQPFTWTDGIDAVGTVLDPATLIALNVEIAAATSVLEASRIELERAESLFKAGENVPRKSVDTALTQVRADEFRLKALRVRLPLEWGELFAGMEEAKRAELAEKLTTRASALVRVEAMGEPVIPGKITGAQVFVFGTTINVERLVPAPAVNERTQALAYLVLCNAGGQPLPNGTSVSARLTGPGKPRLGVEVPGDAVVRQGPQAWVYVETAPHDYVRVPVPLKERTESGWFVSGNDRLGVGTKVVTTGAAALLSAELVSAGFGGAEE